MRTHPLIELITSTSVPMFVLIGVGMGPSLLGWVSPDVAWLRVVGEIGIVTLLGVAGLQVEMPALMRTGWSGFRVAVLGMAFSFAGVYLFTAWWGSPAQESLYAGIAFTATSIGITTHVLHQFGLMRDIVGRTIVAAAVVDDVIALYFLAVAHAMLTDTIKIGHLAQSVLLAFSVILTVYLTTLWLGRLCRRGSSGARSWRPIIALSLIYLGALATHGVGLSTVVGGFFAGLGLGHGLGTLKANAIAKRLNPLVLITVPFFFILIGTRAKISVLTEPAIVVFVVTVFGIAVAGKMAGGVIGAGRVLDFRRRLLVGMGMAPRGEVALVVASIGLAQGHLSHHVYVAIVLIALITAITMPLLMVRLAITAARHSTPPVSPGKQP